MPPPLMMAGDIKTQRMHGYD